MVGLLTQPRRRSRRGFEVLDIDVAPLLLRTVTVLSTDRGADMACRAVLTPFTGAALVAAVTGGEPAMLVPGLLRLYATGVAVPVAVELRGAVLLNAAGRVGVVVGPGVVVQPAGRQYALTPTAAAWWVSGWVLSTVTATMVVTG